MGPYIEEGTPYCRVNLRSDTDIENTGLFVRTKERYSTNIPITGEPTWIQYRFPLPEGHQARTLSYYANRGRLFGTHPDSCHPSEHDSNGDCQLTALASDEDWSDPVPAGIFMLWADVDPVQSGLSVDHMNPVLISHGPKWSATSSMYLKKFKTLKNS